MSVYNISGPTAALGEISRMPVRNRVTPYQPVHLRQQEFIKWFERKKPDAIITISPHLDVLQWLTQTGYQVPEQVGFANLDCPNPEGEISGVFQSPEIIGMTSVNVLAGLIQSNDLGLPDNPQTVLMRGRWINGRTTRSIK